MKAKDRMVSLKAELDRADTTVSNRIVSNRIRAIEADLRNSGPGISFKCTTVDGTPAWWGKVNGVWCFYAETSNYGVLPILLMPRHFRLIFHNWLADEDRLYTAACVALEAAIEERNGS